MITRLLDILVSLLGLLVLLPLLPFIALLIKIDSKGPVFYLCDRVGLNGKIFKMYKFRTMYETPVRLGPSLSPQGDPRVTTVGLALRRLKLNEFPQFFNVLKGDMTLVGPRPETPDLAAAYPEEAKEIFTVKPGLVGPNQILGRNEEEFFPRGVDPVEYYLEHILPGKLAVDLQYIRDKSVWRDLKCIFLAAKVVVTGAISKRHLFDNRSQILFLLCDAVLCLFSLTLAHYLRYDNLSNPREASLAFFKILPWAVLVRLPIFMYFGFYNILIRHLSFFDIKRVFQGVTLSSLILTGIAFLFGFTKGFYLNDIFIIRSYARGVFYIDWLCLTTLLIGYRVLVRKIYLWRQTNHMSNHDKKRALIWGAGDAGELCLRYLQKENNPAIEVVGFIDDDPKKKGKRILGVKILGDRHNLTLLSQLHNVREVFVAIPSASFDELKNILDVCHGFNLEAEIFLAKNDISTRLSYAQQHSTEANSNVVQRARSKEW
jgi:lipopolysaccharide/colanic/teichoic acid biosynthesis glycosyltransferase